MDRQQRIAVIGSPGGGKSTLATAIARVSGLPLVHLDREYWRAGWVEPDKADWQARNAGLVAQSEWVIDGNYAGSLAARLERATLVVWLDLPTPVCLAGALRRTRRYRRGGRPDMAEGCTERFDFEYLKFLYFILTFRRLKRPGIARRLAAGGVPVVRVRSTADRAAFLRRLGAGGLAAVTPSPG